MVPQVQPVGIATIKPKRKYTKRKAKLTVVKQIKPKVRKELPKTASAYLRTLGMSVEKESAAVTELIKLHHALNKAEAVFQPLPVDIGLTGPEEPKGFWLRFVKRFAS